VRYGVFSVGSWVNYENERSARLVSLFTQADNLAHWVGSLIVVGLGEYKLCWAAASASA
jgi:hypothetical protein